jgi:hypothetical protein
MVSIPENLSVAARQIAEFNPDAYQQLVVTGDGNPKARELLDRLSPKDIFASGSTKPVADARAVLAGLWLWHDWLEPSHGLSQSLDNATGSFWHAIMHRREGDFSNSKYWYAKVGAHPVLAALANQVGAIVNQQAADNRLLRLVSSGWNPNALVDLVESVEGDAKSPLRSVAILLQQMEWRALFDYCARA